MLLGTQRINELLADENFMNLLDVFQSVKDQVNDIMNAIHCLDSLGLASGYTYDQLQIRLSEVIALKNSYYDIFDEIYSLSRLNVTQMCLVK